MQIKYERCLLELMKTKSYASISINDICRQMGTTRKSFYYFFKNKNGCLLALIDRLFYEFPDFKPSQRVDPKGYPRKLIYLVLYELETREVVELFLRNDLYGLLTERFYICFRENALKKKQIYPSSFEEDELTFQVYGMMAIRRRWHESGYQQSIYEVAESIYRLGSMEILENW